MLGLELISPLSLFPFLSTVISVSHARYSLTLLLCFFTLNFCSNKISLLSFCLKFAPILINKAHWRWLPIKEKILNKRCCYWYWYCTTNMWCQGGETVEILRWLSWVITQPQWLIIIFSIRSSLSVQCSGTLYIVASLITKHQDDYGGRRITKLSTFSRVVRGGLALYSNMSPPLPSRLHMRYMRNFYWKGYKDCLSQGQGESPPGGSSLLLARNNNSYPHSYGDVR